MAVTILAVGIGTLMVRAIETRIVDAAGKNLSLAAAEIANKLDRFLYERWRDGDTMAGLFVSRMHDKEALKGMSFWLKEMYQPVYLLVAVTDSQGKIIVATDQSAVGKDFSQSWWFQDLRKAGKTQVGDVGPYPLVNGAEAVAFTTPIIDEKHNFLGAVTFRVGVNALADVLTRTIREIESPDLSSGALAYQFLTAEGRVFIDSASRDQEGVNLKERGQPSAVLSESGGPGFVEEEHPSKWAQVVTGYAQTKGHRDFPGLGWTVLLRMDREKIVLGTRELVWKLGMMGGAVWFPMMALLLWATGRLRKEYLQAQQESEWARAAEGALLQSQERTRVIVDTALDGVITTDSAGIITDWNAQAGNIFGWPREEALGRRLSDTIIPPRDREIYERGLRHYIETGEAGTVSRRIEIMAYHRDGHEFPVELAVSPARLGDAYIFSAFVRDITERRQAEHRLASQYEVTRVLSESRSLEEAAQKILQAICETLEWELSVFWRLDRQGNVLRCLDLWQAPSLQAEEFVLETWQHHFERGMGLPGRVWAMGKPTWIVDAAQEPNFPRAAVAAKAGLHGAIGFPIRIAGEIEGVVELFSRRVQEPDRQLLKMVEDLGLKIGQFGERTRAIEDLRRTEAQLQQSQKMEAVGRLAGGVAHDFNNMLTVIRGYSDLALMQLKENQAIRRELEEIRKAADRASALTGQLLAFSRRQFVAPKVVDLNAIIHNLEGMVRRLLGEDVVELNTVLDPDVGHIKVDGGQVEQVIMNLAVNARDAMPNGGRLTIETSNITIGEWTGPQVIGACPGSYVMLVVRDTGSGMDEETMSHIFEPFFTTKEKGKGTGLGLSMVYGIVKQTGGHIEVESKPGRGATFRIYFPRADESTAVGQEAVLGATLIKGKETVLLVEDEPGVRRLVLETLRLQGYTVLEARHGIEALVTGSKHVGSIDLLLTDVVMPQMSGPEVAEKLAAVRPEMKILYMSGYPDHPIFAQGEVNTHNAFLQKPFTPQTLAQKVREVLDGVKAA